MAVMFEQGKIAALGVTALGLLFVIIGLATPISTIKAGTIECDGGIRDRTCGSVTTNAWDDDCGSNDNCKAAQSMLKAGFTFCFFGILANLVFIASLVKANGFADAIPAPLGEQMPTAGLGGACVLLYLIGWACAISGYPKAYGDLTGYDVSVGAGGALLIIAWLLTIAATGLAFAGIDGDGADTSAPGAPAAAAAANKPADVEAPATEAPAAEAPAAPAEEPAAKE